MNWRFWKRHPVLLIDFDRIKKDEETFLEKEIGLLPKAFDAGTPTAFDGILDKRRNLVLYGYKRMHDERVTQLRAREGEVSRKLRKAQADHDIREERRAHTREAFDAARRRMGVEASDDAPTRREPGRKLAGYENPSVISLVPPGIWLYGTVLVLAGALDLAAFYQVIQLVLRTQGWPWLLMATVGVTAVALGMAHILGRVLRDLRAGVRSIRPWKKWALLIPWVALGIGIFALRLLVDNEGQVSIEQIEAGGSLITGTDAIERTWARALLLLFVYFATGAVAILGAYFLHNRLREEYARAWRTFRGASRKASRSGALLERRSAEFNRHHKGLEDEEQRWEDERARIQDLFAYLQDYARLLMLRQRPSPSMTDGLFPPPPMTPSPSAPAEPLPAELPPNSSHPRINEPEVGR